MSLSDVQLTSTAKNIQTQDKHETLDVQTNLTTIFLGKKCLLGKNGIAVVDMDCLKRNLVERVIWQIGYHK